MNRLKQISLRKSLSSYQKKQTTDQDNPEHETNKQKLASPMEQMILQKYNFAQKPKINLNELCLRKQSVKKSSPIVNTNMIVISQFPKIQHFKFTNTSVSSIFDKQKQKQSQGKHSALTLVDLSTLRERKRDYKDYKECKKRIEMSTTYRGFNMNRDKILNKSIYIPKPNHSLSKNQETPKNINKLAQRKRMIHCIIERGFAKKIEESLLKVRTTKQKGLEKAQSLKSPKLSSPLKAKRSVIFSNAASLPTESQAGKKSDGKESLIEPW